MSSSNSRFLSVVCFVLWSSTAANAMGGSWASQVGGNLLQLAASDVDCGRFESVTYRRVQMPVGWGVEHEYIGVTLKTTGGTHVFVTGLNGETDLAAFKRHVVQGSDEISSHVVKRTTSCARFIAELQRINRYMADSAYNYSLVYSLAMIARPVGGQPCSNMTDAIEQILQ